MRFSISFFLCHQATKKYNQCLAKAAAMAVVPTSNTTLTTVATNATVAATTVMKCDLTKELNNVSLNKPLKAVCHAFDWVIWTIQRIGNLNGC